MLMQTFLLLVGLALLLFGAEWLVKGASGVAAMIGVSSLVIGLTVVACGTSAPELAVSLQAGLAGNPDIAVANVVGSNIFNVLLILGLCALIAPLAVNRQLVRFDAPLTVLVSLLMWKMSDDLTISRVEGLFLALGLIVYTTWLVVMSRRETAVRAGEVAAASAVASSSSAPSSTPPPTAGAESGLKVVFTHIFFILAGLGLLVLGARLLVGAATALARAWGVSDMIIGLTIVAAGTSLPEVATSLVATWRGERDLAIGNVVGSNIFNILGILGIAGLVTPGGLTVALPMVSHDIPVMVGVAAICLPVFFSGFRISRFEGIAFLIGYGLYLGHMILATIQHHALENFSRVALYGILPIIFGLLLWETWRERSGSEAGGS